jgi:anti-sigma factor RsiW
MEHLIVTEEKITRYLLGELPADEQTALEEAFLTDPRVFTHVAEVENDLVDDYVRRRLPPREHARFERHYLANPSRRRRVDAARELLPRIHLHQAAGRTTTDAIPRRVQIHSFPRNRPWALGVALASAAMLLAFGGLLAFEEIRRLRAEVSNLQAARIADERRARELEQQVAAEQDRNRQLTAELEQRKSQLNGQPTAPGGSALTDVVTLLLPIERDRGERSSDPPNLVITHTTRQVRLVLRMRTSPYNTYRATLQTVAGETVWRLKPQPGRLTPTFTVNIPANVLTSGDYILTFDEMAANGEVDTLKKSLLRVTKR